MMTPIARRGDVVAWADEPFDPATDDVELRSESGESEPVTVRWQSALKFGYWESYEDDPTD